jgi:hypothetical protein
LRNIVGFETDTHKNTGTNSLSAFEEKAEKDEPKNLNRAMDEVRNLKRARQKVPPQERIAGNNDKTDNRSLLVVLILAVDGHRGGRKWLLLEARKRAVEQAFSMLREH